MRLRSASQIFSRCSPSFCRYQICLSFLDSQFQQICLSASSSELLCAAMFGTLGLVCLLELQERLQSSSSSLSSSLMPPCSRSLSSSGVRAPGGIWYSFMSLQYSVLIQNNNRQSQQPTINKTYNIYSMSKNQQRILQLHSLLSKLLDSLCCELCVNLKDANSLSLLEILLWVRKGEIDQAEFMELYRSWLESKSVFDLLTCRQGEIYPKADLIAHELVQQHFMNIGQINKALQVLNTAYNKLFRDKKPNNWAQLEQAERIFSYLDEPGYIHLRLPGIFFLTGAVVVLERYTFPINYESFRIHMNDLRKQMCQVEGVVSLRSFKNYILNLNSIKRTNFLDNLLNVFAQFETAIGADRNSMPNLFDEALAKWRNFPRFSSNQGRKNLEIYRRVFEENERVFMDEGASVEYFEKKYGQQFVKCFQIDNLMLREFNVLLKQSLNRYIELFAKVAHKYNNRSPTEKGGNLFMTHRKKQTSQLHQLKMGNKGSSMKQKTPTKSQRTIEFRNKTPTKTLNFDNNIRKQFGSADKSKSKNKSGRRQLTPTKSFRPQTSVLHYSQANPINHKNAIKLGVDKDSVYNRMHFFRNKRVESYEIVMKRLKNIK